MTKDFDLLYGKYVDILQKAADFNYAAAVLGWDQEVYMPKKGADARGRQLATLAAEAHRLITSDALGALLTQLNHKDLQVNQGTEKIENVRLSLQDYEKNKKLPVAFVEELSLLTSESFNAWVDARNKNDFQLFAPYLKKMVALKRRQAQLYGYTAHPYDALLNEYEKGATVAMLEHVFAGVKEKLPVLLAKIKAAPQVDDSCFYKFYAKDPQWGFSLKVLQQMGFDFEAGRQDYSEHPFTTSFSPNDVRITTRVDEYNYASMLWSCIHEGGHGLYEQGLPENQYGLPLGEAASLGIHESQSRLWENCIGRGKGFWAYFYPHLQQIFADQLGGTSTDTFYKASNKVEPSLIRTEADEITYHFHVIIRYELEKALLEGTLETKDVAAEWNRLYLKYLGVVPKDDKTGVLQDVHWSHGMFGYFPTYSLGSFYAAQFYAQAEKDIPGFAEKIANGDFGDLLAWLRKNIHQYGRRYTSEELCERVTGNRLDPASFLAYAEEKLFGVYGI